MKRRREETIITPTTIITTTTTTTTPPPVILKGEKEEEEEESERQEEFKQEYFFNGKQRIRLSLLPQREDAHDYQKQICLEQSEFSSHDLPSIKHDSGIAQTISCDDSFRKACLKINDKYLFKSHNSQYIYLNISILDIPNDILGIIITFTDIIGKHVFRFVNKHFHNIVHSVVGSNLILLKSFYLYDYAPIIVKLGNIELFDWFMFIFGKSIFLRSNVLNVATSNGNLDLMKHTKKRYNYKWNIFTSYKAASGGHLGILKWLFENNCPWDEQTCTKAAKNGHLDVLKWLKKNKCPWDWKTCYYAAKVGYFEILKWARKNDCPWNSEITYAAARFGHFGILKWAEENGCCCDTSISYGAAEGGNLEILKRYAQH
jgi:hypothetical protein